MSERRNNRSTMERRVFVAGIAGAVALPLARARPTAGLTPAQTLGPFYPRRASERPRETDADLMRLDGDRVRYGRATLHEECGVASAINDGDYLLGVGYRIITGLPGLDSATTRDLVAILSAAHMRLARGQGAELWWRDPMS